MGTRWKYVMVATDHGPQPITSSVDIPVEHKELAYPVQKRVCSGAILSAGFYHFAGGQVVVERERSESLGIGPAEGDAAIIRQGMLEACGLGGGA